MNKKKNIAIVFLTLAVFTLLFLYLTTEGKLNQKNIEIKMLVESNLNSENKLTLMESMTIDSEFIEAYDEISYIGDHISIPAYNNPTYFSLINFDGLSVSEYDSDFYQLTIQEYLPRWVIDLDLELLNPINELAYINKDSVLRQNTHSTSNVTHSPVEGTPVVIKYIYEDMMYVESLIIWDVNTIYKGWIEAENVDLKVTSNKNYENRFFFIPKNTQVRDSGENIVLVQGEWGLFLHQTESDYVLGVKHGNVYEISNEILFID